MLLLDKTKQRWRGHIFLGAIVKAHWQCRVVVVLEAQTNKEIGPALNIPIYLFTSIDHCRLWCVSALRRVNKKFVAKISTDTISIKPWSPTAAESPSLNIWSMTITINHRDRMVAKLNHLPASGPMGSITLTPSMNNRGPSHSGRGKRKVFG